MGVAAIVVIVNLCGMMEWTPKVAPPFALNMFAFVLILVAHGLRRRGRATGPSA